MQHIVRINYSIFILVFLFLSSCRYDKVETSITPETGYPAEVDAIITKKCATSGCHNSINPSANLDLTTMDQMLKGNSTGAIIIPFRADQSTLLFFTNTDSAQGPKLTPTMPVNQSPLSKQEYLTLKNWIAAGAPYKNGNIPFSGDPNRKKIYVVNQGCDLLSVFDANERVIMRYKDLGVLPGVSESPHDIKITPDGQYYLVVFLNANIVQLFRTIDDSLVANIPVGDGISGNWNTLTFSSDSRKAYVVDYLNGRIAYVDLLAKTSTTTPPFANSLHGIALNATDDTLFVTEDLGSRLFTIPVNDIANYDERNLRLLYPDTGVLGLHQIDFTPDGSKYFITCANANQLWVFDANTNALLDTFHVGKRPLEMSVSETKDYIFITCEEDNVFNNVIGSVEVFNYKTLVHVKTIEVGWQPHGIAVDDEKGLVYVVNRNVNPNGPAPHHTSACGGRNGTMTFIDLNTLKAVYGSPELSPDPYEIDVRH